MQDYNSTLGEEWAACQLEHKLDYAQKDRKRIGHLLRKPKAEGEPDKTITAIASSALSFDYMGPAF